jgi:hypothetical protein
MLTSCAASVLGDVATQAASPLPVDPKRVLTFGLLGAFYLGPLLHTWYEAMGELGLRLSQGPSPLPRPLPRPLVVLLQVLLGQLLFAPLLSVGLVVAHAAAEALTTGKPFLLPAAAEQAKLKLRKLLVASWSLWPAAAAVNFAIVPPAQRVLFSNAVSVAHSSLVSLLISS